MSSLSNYKTHTHTLLIRHIATGSEGYQEALHPVVLLLRILHELPYPGQHDLIDKLLRRRRPTHRHDGLSRRLLHVHVLVQQQRVGEEPHVVPYVIVVLLLGPH